MWKFGVRMYLAISKVPQIHNTYKLRVSQRPPQGPVTDESND